MTTRSPSQIRWSIVLYSAIATAFALSVMLFPSHERTEDQKQFDCAKIQPLTRDCQRTFMKRVGDMDGWTAQEELWKREDAAKASSTYSH